MSKNIFFFLTFFGSSFHLFAAPPVLLKSIYLKHSKIMTTDDLVNIYIVDEENALLRFDENGDSSLIFRTLKHGEMTHIDASNPLQILLYFSKFSTLMILDKELSIKSSYDLKKSGFFNISAISTSSDGGFWMFNQTDATLIKFDAQLNILQKSNDLRTETNLYPEITTIVEEENTVYLCDTLNGLFMFHRNGRFLNQIPEIKSKNLQIIGNQLIYLQENEVMVYNLKSFSKKSIPLSVKEYLLDARVTRNRLILLFQDKLDIFKLED